MMYRDKDKIVMKLCWYFRSVQALLTIIKKAPKVTLFFTRRYNN